MLLLVTPVDSMSFCFGSAEPLFAERGISLVAASRSDFVVTCVQASHCWGYCCCRAQALEHRLGTYVAWAWLLQGTWYPPRPGIKSWVLCIGR